MSHSSLIPSVKFYIFMLIVTNNLFQLFCATSTDNSTDTEFHCKLKWNCIVKKKSFCISVKLIWILVHKKP